MMLSANITASLRVRDKWKLRWYLAQILTVVCTFDSSSFPLSPFLRGAARQVRTKGVVSLVIASDLHELEFEII